MRLVEISLLKLTRRPATRRTVLLLAGFLALIYISLGLSARAIPDASGGATIGAMLAFPDAHGGLAGMLLIFSGMAGAAYAGAVAGSEWSWNTFRVALTRGESRVRYVLGLFGAIALLALLAWIILYALGVGLILLANALGGTRAGDALDPANLGRLSLMVASGGLAVVMEMAVGFGVAFIARSQVAGIVAVVGLFFAERFAEMFVSADVLRFAPITAATSLVTAAGKSGLDGNLVGPLVMTLVYLLAAIGAACFAARRAEVT
jgi:hypothetical protein